MNKARRAKLLDAAVKMEEAREIIEACAQEEMDGYENLSEGLKATAQGIAMEEAGSTLDDLVGTMQDVIDSINGVIE